MAKRYIERPTARQIMTEHDRNVAREARKDAYERVREANADWLAANYVGRPMPEPPPPLVKVKPPSRAEQEFARFCAFVVESSNANTFSDVKGASPGLIRISDRPEPKSIYSPASPSKIKFERPKARKGRDPLAAGKDCEIPDYRKHQTYVVEDADGRARGAIQINPFSKRIAIGGFGLSGRK